MLQKEVGQGLPVDVTKQSIWRKITRQPSANWQNIEGILGKMTKDERIAAIVSSMKTGKGEAVEALRHDTDLFEAAWAKFSNNVAAGKEIAERSITEIDALTKKIANLKHSRRKGREHKRDLATDLQKDLDDLVNNPNIDTRVKDLLNPLIEGSKVGGRQLDPDLVDAPYTISVSLEGWLPKLNNVWDNIGQLERAGLSRIMLHLLPATAEEGFEAFLAYKAVHEYYTTQTDVSSSMADWLAFKYAAKTFGAGVAEKMVSYIAPGAKPVAKFVENSYQLFKAGEVVEPEARRLLGDESEEDPYQLNKGGYISPKVKKLYEEGFTAPGQAYAIAKRMGYNYGGLVDY